MLDALRRFFRHPMFQRHPPAPPVIVLRADGFELRRPDGVIGALPWAAVERIVTYKRDHLTTDEILVAFEYRGPAGTPMTLAVSEEWAGFPEFMVALAHAFPSLPADWYAQVMKPAFVPNYRVLYPVAAASSAG